MGETQHSGGTDQHGVVVGWGHTEIGNTIDLKVQSAVSKQALSRDAVDDHHFLMTRNQALLLANYLLKVTHQTLPPPPTRGIAGRFRRLFG